MGRKTSIVWNHFTIPALFPKKALCNYCRQLVCRGQTNLGTTSLMNHLKRCNEFKAAVLGLPKGVNEIMADVFSNNSNGEQTQQVRNVEQGTNSDEALAEFHNISDEEIINRTAVSAINEDTLLQSNSSAMPFLAHNVTDSPSLVGRQSWAPSTKKAKKEYRNNGRPSMLLYGDISSTSEEEEPSSSNVCEPDTSHVAASVDNLTNYMASNSTVNFVYGGFMLHIMYEQYKTGKFCDLHIIPQKATNEATISETGKIVHGGATLEKRNSKISVHACLMTAVSRKINTLVEMGCTSVQLKKGGLESVKGLVEIIYTGKLDKIRKYSETELVEILEVAKFLEVDLAIQYLMREIPESKPKSKTAKQRELFHEQMLALSHNKRPMPSLVNSSKNSTAVKSRESSWRSLSHVNPHHLDLHSMKSQKLSITDSPQNPIFATHSDMTTEQENLHNHMIRQRLIARLLPKSSNEDDETVTELYDDADKADSSRNNDQLALKMEYFDEDNAENNDVFAHLKTNENEVSSHSR